MYQISSAYNLYFCPANKSCPFNMKVIDYINQAKDTILSYEVLPPLKGKNINSLFQHLDPLMKEGLNSINGSRCWNRELIFFPFNGGKTS